MSNHEFNPATQREGENNALILSLPACHARRLAGLFISFPSREQKENKSWMYPVIIVMNNENPGWNPSYHPINN